MRFWCFILFFLLISAGAQAETVVLVEADAIHGEITRKTDSSIILIHKVFGELEIPKDQIAGIRIVHNVLGEIEIPSDQLVAPAGGKPEAETVALVGADAINGQITEKTDSAIILVHEALGRLEIPKDRIVSITVLHDVLGAVTIPADRITSLGASKPETETPQGKKPAGKKETKQEKEKDVWFEPEFEKLDSLAARLKKMGWSFAADFSIDSTTGNNEEEASRLGVHIKRTLPDEILALDMSYYHKISDGRVTDNKFTTGAIKDWLNPGSRWFFFGAGRYDYDEFESWQQRANLQVGPGYNLIRSDDVLLNLRLGAGGRKEWGSQNSDFKFEGLAGIDFEWKLTEKQAIGTSIWYFPVLTDTDDYRTRATLNWRYLLAKEMNLSLVVGLLQEYQSIVDPGNAKSETRTHVGLQVRF